MHSIKALAIVCISLIAVSYALPMPSDMTLSYIQPKSESMALRMEAREEDVEDVEDDDLTMALRS